MDKKIQKALAAQLICEHHIVYVRVHYSIIYLENSPLTFGKRVKNYENNHKFESGLIYCDDAIFSSQVLILFLLKNPSAVTILRAQQQLIGNRR